MRENGTLCALFGGCKLGGSSNLLLLLYPVEYDAYLTHRDLEVALRLNCRLVEYGIRNHVI